ncbi:MAG: MFS transporter, partial [Chloroflexia bacterium]|nr:MFS transporter [Chloroflexia bacterium]
AYWCVDFVSPTVPTIRDSLNLSATTAGLIFSVFFGGRLLTNLPAAWLVDRSGPRLTAGLGAAILLAGSVLVAVAQTEATLLPARGVQGAGVALLATAGLLSVLRVLPGGGAAMTTFNLSIGAGGSAGLLLGGFLSSTVGWRAVFWVSAGISAILLLLAILARSQEVEVRAVGGADRDGAPAATRGALWLAIGANFVVFINYAIWVLGIPLLSAEKFGLNATDVGLVLLFVNLVHLGAALPFGRVISLAGAPIALAIGFGLAGLGLMLAPMADSPWVFAGPVALYAMGQVAGNSSAGDLILRKGGGGGKAVGAVRLSSDIGMVVGPAAAGVIADVAGVEAPFWVLGALSIACAGAVGASRMRR